MAFEQNLTVVESNEETGQCSTKQLADTCICTKESD